MKLTINRTDLIRAVSTASQVIVGRTALPVLFCALLQASDSAIKATCSDLDRYLTTEADATVEEEGACAVSARLLTATLQKMDSAEVSLVHAKGQLTVTGGQRTMKLCTLPAGEFPKMPEAPNGVVKLPAGVMGAALKAVAPFASNEYASRQTICGVFLEWREDLKSMVTVTTDGRRLGMFAAETMPKIECKVIVPNDVVKVLVALDESDAPAEVGVMVLIGENTIHARGYKWMLTAKQIDGKYPNYVQVIPAEGHVNITFDRVEMMGALAFSALSACDAIPGVKFTADDAQIGISANAPAQSESLTTVTRLGKKIHRKPVEVAYPPDSLRDLLDFIGGEECTLNMEDEKSPCVARNGSATAVLMPYRVQ